MTVDSLLLNQTIDQIPFNNGRFHHSGKVRESFVLDEPRRAIVVTDRVSAFDFNLGTIPHKGAVLNGVAAWWFNQLSAIEVPHHLIDTPHPNISVVRNAKPLPIEIVVRGYLTGSTTTSSWYAYQNHGRKICGLEMPEGMKKNEIFPEPILTPTTKPEEGHDRNISKEEILEEGLVSQEIYARAEDYAFRMFALGQQLAAEKGLILVDTKYEMGLTAEGQLIVIDEIHTPDSSRFWIADSYQERLAAGQEPQSLDKEFVRSMLVAAGYEVDNEKQNPKNFMTDDLRLQAAEKYLALYKKITGLELDLEAREDLLACLGRL